MRPWLMLVLLLVPCSPVRAEPDSWVFLNGPAEIHGMRRGDVNGDGIRDLFVLYKRQLVGWKGLAGQLPDPEPTWNIDLPNDVSFVDLDTAHEGLLLYGKRGLVHWNASDLSKRTPLADAAPLDWADRDRAVFATLTDSDGGRMLPTAEGVRWQTKGGVQRSIAVAHRRSVEASGPFLEDAASAVIQQAIVWPGRSPGSSPQPALWTLADRVLTGYAGQTIRFRFPTRPPTGDRRLHDFHGDGVPEVFQRSGNVREGHYTIFEAPVGGPVSQQPAEVKTASARVSLAGFQLDPEFPDVNQDGRDDLVITTIAMDGPNLLRAVTSGRVTAETNLFLNRSAADPQTLFQEEPDMRVKSEIGVKLHFTYAGTIDVKRSFTIVTQGDYDGDGVRDLLIRTAPDTVTVRSGTRSGVWTDEGRTVRIPPIGDHPDIEGYADDLDGQPEDRKTRRDELLLLYRKAPGGHDRLCIVRVP